MTYIGGSHMASNLACGMVRALARMHSKLWALSKRQKKLTELRPVSATLHDSAVTSSGSILEELWATLISSSSSAYMIVNLSYN